MSNKILFLINLDGFGGAEKVFRTDSEMLREKGYSVYNSYLFGEKVSKNEFEFYVKSKSIFDLKALMRLNRFIKEKQIETVYATLNESNFFARFLKFFNPSLQVFIREANMMDIKPWHFRMADVLLNFLVNKIVAVSNDVKISGEKYLWMYKNKFCVLMNGVEMPTSCKQYGERVTGPLKFVSVGSFTTKKGHMIFMEVLARLKSDGINNFTLDIYGGREDRRDMTEVYEKFIIQNSLSDKVKLHTRVNPENIDKVFLENDIFVLSSLHEGCPNVLLEACSFGLVCLANNVSGVKEILNNQNDFIYNNKDEFYSILKNILLNTDSFKDIGKSNRENVATKFSNEVHINKLMTLLNLTF